MLGNKLLRKDLVYGNSDYFSITGLHGNRLMSEDAKTRIASRGMTEHLFKPKSLRNHKYTLCSLAEIITAAHKKNAS